MGGQDQLRRSLRARRAALTPEQQRTAAARLIPHVTATRLFRVSRRIACYFPNDGEIDPTPLMDIIRSMRKQCYVPVLSRLSHESLWFAEAHRDTPLVFNRFGIPEPAVPARDLVRARELDLILAPLVAFDRAGNRLGMGGGFYDRSLAFLRHRHHWRKPHLLGLAHDFQQVDTLPANPWDIPLQGVVTDRGVYLVPSESR
jgi:5-formyltetrahydrofolate cyclo-ligase